MKSTIGFLGVFVGLALASGCSPNGALDVSDEDIAAQWLNDGHDNSESVNGMSANGMSANGMSANGMSANGISYSGLSYTGTSLKAKPSDQGLEVDGTSLTGVDVAGNLTNGAPLSIRIASISYNSVAGLFVYFLKYYDGTSWQWICGTDGGGNPIAALPIMKAYLHPTYDEDPDQNRFSFGCVNAAIAKCALWGYKPWTNNYPETYGSTKYRNLSISHQACQRMVRADYCGDGVSHTRNGTPIDVYDAYNIQNPANISGNTLEAEWRPDGAYCIQHTRWGTADSIKTDGLTDLQYIQAHCPSRLAANDTSCNNDANSSYYKANGFNLSNQATRRLLRNESYQH